MPFIRSITGQHALVHGIASERGNKLRKFWHVFARIHSRKLDGPRCIGCTRAAKARQLNRAFDELFGTGCLETEVDTVPRGKLDLAGTGKKFCFEKQVLIFKSDDFAFGAHDFGVDCVHLHMQQGIQHDAGAKRGACDRRVLPGW